LTYYRIDILDIALIAISGGWWILWIIWRGDEIKAPEA
jgi:hypothetical protein